MATGETIEAYGYVRVSSDEQYESGAGRNAQVDAIEAAAARNGWTLVKIIEESEGVSGETPEDRRPGLVEAMGLLRKGDILLVSKRDRLMRDNIRIALLETYIRNKLGARLVSAAGEGTEVADPRDPTAFLQRTIIDGFARYELLLIRYRTRSAMAGKRRRGERVGNIPYGFDLADDGRRSKPKIRRGEPGGNLPIALTPNPAELGIIGWMLGLREQRWTYDRITWALGQRGIMTKQGRPWCRSSVRHILTQIQEDPCHPARVELGKRRPSNEASPTSSET